MKHFNFNQWDLVGFLDTDEQVSTKELEQITTTYNKLVDGASEEEKKDFNTWFDDGDYYPPFVAKAISEVLK